MGKKRKFKGFDPAEYARRQTERQRHTRNTPAEWGVNREALSLAQNADVEVIDQTREKVSRVTRFDCFVTLKVETGAFLAVRRYQDLLATIHGCDGSDHMSAKVDGGGSREMLNARWIKASNDRDALLAEMLPWHVALIDGLSLPSVVLGQSVNWQAEVRKATKLIDRDAQARAVKTAAEGVRRAWEAFDNETVRRAA